jgi:ParB-like chromosome segregation protein Spo0J
MSKQLDPNQVERDDGGVPSVASVFHASTAPKVENSAQGREILELDPAFVLTSECNPPIPLDSISGLLESIRTYQQLVIGIVALHPEKPGYWICLDGNRRLLVCRILGIRFKAVEHSGKVTKGSLAATRIAANRSRRQMSDEELAADLAIIVEEDGCTQAEAARKHGVSSTHASQSKCFSKRAVSAVKQALANRTIVQEVGRMIALAPAAQQEELLARAIADKLTAADVADLAKDLSGKAAQGKTLKFTCLGIEARIKNPSVDNLQRYAKGLVAALKCIAKDGSRIERLPEILATILKV